jgi:flagellar motor switch protein FliG
MAETLQEDMEYMGPVRLRDVEDAQQRIVGIIRHLEDAGEIVIGRSGGDDVIV